MALDRGYNRDTEVLMKYISSTPDIMDGTPVIVGTRIPIEVILYRLKDGYTLDELQEMYDWVDRQTLDGAIDEAISYILQYPTTDRGNEET
jgi:uncharacterized protein (DUF433 family)